MNEELGARARADDGTAFEQLLRANALSMLRFADFVLHDRSAAEDAVQEAFMIAWSQRRGLRDESSFTPWLRTIVLRECLRWRRRFFRQVLGLNDRVVAPPAADATAQLDVARAVRRLAPPVRAVIYLHFYEDRTLSQVASELGIPESTTKTRLYGALQQLARSLTGYGPQASGGAEKEQ